MTRHPQQNYIAQIVTPDSCGTHPTSSSSMDRDVDYAIRSTSQADVRLVEPRSNLTYPPTPPSMPHRSSTLFRSSASYNGSTQQQRPQEQPQQQRRPTPHIHDWNSTPRPFHQLVTPAPSRRMSSTQQGPAPLDIQMPAEAMIRRDGADVRQLTDEEYRRYYRRARDDLRRGLL